MISPPAAGVQTRRPHPCDILQRYYITDVPCIALPMSVTHSTLSVTDTAATQDASRRRYEGVTTYRRSSPPHNRYILSWQGR